TGRASTIRFGMTRFGPRPMTAMLRGDGTKCHNRRNKAAGLGAARWFVPRAVVTRRMEFLSVRLGLAGLLVTGLIASAIAAADASSRDLKGHGGPIKAIAMSGQGSRALTASFDYSAMYWAVDGATPHMIHRLTGHDA